jgi:polyhydroxyalkanoate synthesis regulator phasin
MQDVVKKLIEFGLEAQSRTAEFLSNTLSKARMDEEERKQFVQDLDKKLEQSREKGEKLMRDILDKMPNPSLFARHKDVEELRQRVERLEERVQALEGKGGTP